VNLHRDLLALTNRHVSAWDTWRSASTDSRDLNAAETVSADRLADEIEAATGAADGIARLRRMAAGSEAPPW
ncbi:hypothetical protein, partial [Klebsiella pneumoniae]